jgi:hypothetical protein
MADKHIAQLGTVTVPLADEATSYFAVAEATGPTKMSVTQAKTIFQAKSAILDGMTASYTTAEETKVGYITVGEARNLDTGFCHSFNARTGTIVPAASDYDAVKIDVAIQGGVTGTDVQNELELLHTSINNATVGDHRYCDSVNGNDSNDGLTTTTAWLTLAKLTSTLPDVEGSEARLMAGSHWREHFILNNTNKQIVRSWGAGPMPIIDGSDIKGTWTIQSGQVWKIAGYTHDEVDGVMSVWEDGELLTRVTSISECQNLAGSYWGGKEPIPSGTITSPSNIYIHPSDSGDPNSNGKVYEVSQRNYAIDCDNVLKVEGVHLKNQIGGNGGIQIDGSGALRHCLLENSNKHHCFVKEESVTGVVCVGQVPPIPGSSNAHIVIYPVDADGKEYAIVDCISVGNIDGTVDNTLSGQFYMHDEAVNDAKKIHVSRCHSAFLNSIGSARTEDLTMVGCTGYYIRSFPRIASAIAMQELTCEDCYFLMDPRSVVVQSFVTAKPMYYRHCGWVDINNEDGPRYNPLFSFGAGNVVTFENCAIRTNGRYTFVNGATPGTITINNTILFNGTESQYNFRWDSGSTYVGDYNIFHYPGNDSQELRIRDDVGATNIETLLAWQTASSQDTNSVWLTDAQAAAFWATDPNYGDFRISKTATATNAAGATVMEFPDGTPFFMCGPRNPQAGWPQIPLTRNQAHGWLLEKVGI